MKEAIYNYIKENPGCRQREIASELHVWLCSKEFLDALRFLEFDNRIYNVSYQDRANMEFYLKWYIVE